MTDAIERPTTASIDRRVERLEASQAATDRKVDSLSERLGYMDDFIKLRFSTVEAAINAQSSKLDVFMSRIESLMLEAARSAGDLEATAAGKQVNGRLKAIETLADEHQSEIDQFRGALRLIGLLGALGSLLGATATILSVLHGSVRL